MMIEAPTSPTVTTNESRTNSRSSTYKTIVVLNNMGITLLQRQRYIEAQLTFKEAIDLMSDVRRDLKNTMSPSSTRNTSSTKTSMKPSSIHEKQSQFLQSASQRMAQSTKVMMTMMMMTPTDTTPSSDTEMDMDIQEESTTTTTTTTITPLITVLSQQLRLPIYVGASDHTAPPQKVAISSSDDFPSDTNYIVHRLEISTDDYNYECSNYNNNDSNTMVIDTAILMHNFSVALRIQVPHPLSSSSTKPRLLQQAKLFHFAHQIIKAAYAMVNELLVELENTFRTTFHNSTTTTNKTTTRKNICFHDYYQQQRHYIETLQLSMILVQELMVFSSSSHQYCGGGGGGGMSTMTNVSLPSFTSTGPRSPQHLPTTMAVNDDPTTTTAAAAAAAYCYYYGKCCNIRSLLLDLQRDHLRWDTLLQPEGHLSLTTTAQAA